MNEINHLFLTLFCIPWVFIFRSALSVRTFSSLRIAPSEERIRTEWTARGFRSRPPLYPFGRGWSRTDGFPGSFHFRHFWRQPRQCIELGQSSAGIDALSHLNLGNGPLQYTNKYIYFGMFIRFSLITSKFEIAFSGDKLFSVQRMRFAGKRLSKRQMVNCVGSIELAGRNWVKIVD